MTTNKLCISSGGVRFTPGSFDLQRSPLTRLLSCFLSTPLDSYPVASSHFDLSPALPYLNLYTKGT